MRALRFFFVALGMPVDATVLLLSTYVILMIIALTNNVYVSHERSKAVQRGFGSISETYLEIYFRGL